MVNDMTLSRICRVSYLWMVQLFVFAVMLIIGKAVTSPNV
jgi:hypothetical protein